MSKTFKALQRAAQERVKKEAQEKKRKPPEAPSPREALQPPPTLEPVLQAPAAATLEPTPPLQLVEPAAIEEKAETSRTLDPVEETPVAETVEPVPPSEPDPESAPAPGMLLRGDPDLFEAEVDPTLRQILEDAFPEGTLPDDSTWTRGDLPREVMRTLLRRYALLHCLRVNPSTWYWFWASEGEAAAKADRSGLELDEQGF